MYQRIKLHKKTMQLNDFPEKFIKKPISDTLRGKQNTLKVNKENKSNINQIYCLKEELQIGFHVLGEH